jgi:RNA polymerase sigma-70 factor, ECF subfamily
MLDIEEKALVEQAQRNPQAFAALYDRYVERIYAFAYRRTQDEAAAEDVTSVTFEKALRHIRSYRWQGISFGAWLYRIAHNEIAQHHRRKRFTLPLLQWHVSEMNVEASVQASEQRDAVQFAFARLSDSDQEVLTLRFFEELSSAEVAEVLGCSIQNVYLRLHRALGRLRKQLEGVIENVEGEEAYVSQ